MPKKTLALISGLILVTIILFAIALSNSQDTPPPAPPPIDTNEQMPLPESVEQTPAHSTLMLSPQPFNIAAGQSGTVDVMIDTSDNEVTAVQLEIAYDPNLITNLKVAPSELFPNPVVLMDKNTVAEGRYTIAFGIMPNQQPLTGVGTVATISFTALNKPGMTSQLALLPTSLVTARGISNSVLKSATGTLIQISQ